MQPPDDSLTLVISGVLPSWNDYINLVGRNRFLCREFTVGWKDYLEAATWEYFDQETLDSFPLPGPIHLIVRVWRPNRIRRDLNNLWLKTACDAFTEVGIWVDDSEVYVPLQTILYMGVDLSLIHI